jgi:16S rRNA (adenine1518-N6/adenine1519-N6)-dimethyltransferase
MVLASLPPLREVIHKHQLFAKKSLGQNFILDLNVTRRIVRSAGDLSGVTVIEIGPGPGGLTRALLESNVNNIIAIERDRRCIDALAELVSISQGRLQIVEEDALKIKLQSLTQGPIKVIANLPYNIATVLLTQWFEDLQNIESLTLMFQKEVALRLIAQPNSKSYGRLSVLSQWLCDVTILFDLSPQVFTPPPKVTSSVVLFRPKALSAEDLQIKQPLCLIVKNAFGQRRKMLRSSLQKICPGKNCAEWLTSLGINPEKRAEDLSISDYCRLAKAWLADSQ